MAIPAYLSLVDSKGVKITGASQVVGREGDIEVLSFTHNITLPAMGSSGKLSGSRIHKEISLEKEFDQSSPYLYRSLATGSTLKKALIKWYRINHTGSEIEYFNILLENVKITAITPNMYNIKDPDRAMYNHIESLSLRYEAITWCYLEGNIKFKDSWSSDLFL
ncbi:type VI secretion system tube protein TssD [Brenneria sp. g21c3]|uniref:Hcp family type VI secretion system effector n=1 Tax=Brenneria sp. g21c3 TaxID=3093893 RepID=UPI002EC2B985|nr:type VI secretion system tube protein TssD [Brenneria sp. g21c3]